MIICDIETSALPDDQLALVMPSFEGPANYVDPVKIAKAVEEKRQAWKDRAALDAKTGQVLAIGLLDSKDDRTAFGESLGTRILTGPEHAMIDAIWTAWESGSRFVGFCIKSFDLPFLVQRSWILGLPVPPDLLEGRYWNRRIVDLQEVWTCFGYRTDGQSLDAICKATGIGAKTGNGKDFAHLFLTDRKAALDYLGTDLELTAKLAQRLGIT